MIDMTVMPLDDLMKIRAEADRLISERRAAESAQILAELEKDAERLGMSVAQLVRGTAPRPRARKRRSSNGEADHVEP